MNMLLTEPSPVRPQGGQLMSVAEAARRIEQGGFFSIAGDEALLRQLPRGNWIGGTICYFMAQQGGQHSRDQVFVCEAEVLDARPQVRFYDLGSIGQVCVDAPDNGYSIIILPAFSAIHAHYAQHAPEFDDMFVKPLVGWVSGTEPGARDAGLPAVINGQTGELDHDRAIVMHVPLPEDCYAAVEIINLQRPGEGDRFRFDETGFSAGECWVNGTRVRLVEYLERAGTDLSLPLVADYAGAMINVSFKGIDQTHGRVDFFAPVFAGVDYRLAAPQRLGAATLQDGRAVAFSCNCILNYINDKLEGRRTGRFTGPMTFGEIAWQLLNQTLVYLTIERVEG